MKTDGSAVAAPRRINLDIGNYSIISLAAKIEKAFAIALPLEGHPLSIVPPKIGINEKVFKDRLARFKFIDSDIKMLNSLNKNNLPFWLVARDNLHPGSCFSEFYSNEFLNQIKKYID